MEAQVEACIQALCHHGHRVRDVRRHFSLVRVLLDFLWRACRTLDRWHPAWLPHAMGAAHPRAIVT